MHYIIIIILSFLLTGCISNIENYNAEHITQTHLAVAESKEKSLNYQDAIKEYTTIFNAYDNTNSQKKAALKVARLNVHPNNPKIDYMAALDWLKIYSNLSLKTEDEEENALILTALIRQITLIQDEKSKLASQVSNQRNGKETLNKKLIACKLELISLGKKSTTYKTEQSSMKKQLSSLEKQLAILNDKLQKIKEIDVQMHKTRKDNTPESP